MMAVVLGLAAPAYAFSSVNGLVCSPRNLVSSPRNLVRTTSSSPHMSASDADAMRPALTLRTTVDVTDVAEDLRLELLRQKLQKIIKDETEEAQAPEEPCGHDPRGPLPAWCTTEMIANLAAKSTLVPKPATASTSPAISSIQTVSELESAVAARPLVVVKYYAPWCRSCLLTKPTFERFAKRHAESAGALEVDREASRLLCKLAGLTTLPCVQIYKEGELVGTHKLGNKERFAAFEETFQLHL